MKLLIIGVLLWSFAHLTKAIVPAIRQRLIDKLGSGPYRGVFTLVILASLALIVIGWRSTPEEYLYVLPAWSRSIGFVLMFVAFALMGATHYATMIKRIIRHPMLMGIFVWSVSHLLTNGTTRALILFGVLGIWALIEMPLINAREGALTLPEAPGFSGELKGLFITAIIFAVVMFLHPYFTGVPLLPA